MNSVKPCLFLQFGPSNKTELINLKIDSWEKWFLTMMYSFFSQFIYSFINMIIRKVNSDNTLNEIGFFEKWLSIWVALCMFLGVIFGNNLPEFFKVLATLEYASVNMVVAILIWFMVYPMMVNVDLSSLRHITDRPKGLLITIFVSHISNNN